MKDLDSSTASRSEQLNRPFKQRRIAKSSLYKHENHSSFVFLNITEFRIISVTTISPAALRHQRKNSIIDRQRHQFATQLLIQLAYPQTMRYAVLVTGPAGAGKSTFCASLITHAQTIGRSVHLVNLDPAADKFEYEPTIDIRDLINLEDVMEELEFGPNGGLIYCFE